MTSGETGYAMVCLDLSKNNLFIEFLIILTKKYNFETSFNSCFCLRL